MFKNGDQSSGWQFRLKSRVCMMICWIRCKLEPVFSLDGPQLLRRALVRHRIRRGGGSRDLVPIDARLVMFCWITEPFRNTDRVSDVGVVSSSFVHLGTFFDGTGASLSTDFRSVPVKIHWRWLIPFVCSLVSGRPHAARVGRVRESWGRWSWTHHCKCLNCGWVHQRDGGLIDWWENLFGSRHSYAKCTARSVRGALLAKGPDSSLGEVHRGSCSWNIHMEEEKVEVKVQEEEVEDGRDKRKSAKRGSKRDQTTQAHETWMGWRAQTLEPMSSETSLWVRTNARKRWRVRCTVYTPRRLQQIAISCKRSDYNNFF